MSRGLKIYIAILGLLVIAGLVKVLYEPSDVRELNAMLQRNEQLKNYPYQFRVLSVDNGVAVMTSPRSAKVSVPEVIKVIDPALQGVSVTDDRFFAAQHHLAELQSSAKKLIESAPTVERVQWQLDERWLSSHGIVFSD
jgi:uncharacterized UPF0160 family protein